PVFPARVSAVPSVYSLKLNTPLTHPASRPIAATLLPMRTGRRDHRLSCAPDRLMAAFSAYAPAALVGEGLPFVTPRLEGNPRAKEQRVKTYTVIYAEDVPHYACGEVEARGPKAAIAKARKLD